MKYVLLVLSFLYASLMIYATINLVSISTHQVIFILNVVGALTIFLYLADYRFLYVGVMLLFVSALLNGHFIMSGITVSHV